MDPALPPGGLQRIFQQFDAIRSHSARDDDPPPWEPEEDQVVGKNNQKHPKEVC
jgi:hypothetical protein